jgi:hypothetical protein
MTKYNDYPIAECAATVGPMVAAGKATFYQKFTCENCLARQTMPTPNTFFELGICEECNHVTDIKKRGCNYMLVTSDPGLQADMMQGSTKH